MSNPKLYEQARDAQREHAKFILSLYGREQGCEVLCGHIVGLTLALRDVIGARQAAEFSYQVSDHLVSLGVPECVGLNAVWDAINRGGEPK